jgi:hypothetical protein
VSRNANLLSEDLPLEDSDNALREIAELLERWENRLTIDNLALTERYVKGELGLKIDFTIYRLVAVPNKERARTKWDRLQYSAIFQGILPASRVQANGLRFEVFGCARRDRNGNDGARLRGPYRNDRAVLVQSVKLVDYPEKFAPSWIWLQLSDQPISTNPNALYFSFRLGFKFFGARRDGECCLPAGLASVGND